MIDVFSIMYDRIHTVSLIFQGERSISITSYYHFLYSFNTNDFISYFLIPSTCLPLSCHSQFDITLLQ